MSRAVLKTVHLWIAIILCVPLVGLGITGSLLVFQHELDDLLDPAPRPSVGAAQSVGAIVAAARASAPAGVAPTLFIAPTGPARAATVRLAPRRADAPGPAAGTLELLIDPASLEILRTRELGAGALRQIFLLHANLLTRDRSGRAIVGWFGVAMLFLGTSGLVLWWPRPGQWRAAFGVRRRARGFRLMRELHGAAGIWGLGVLLVVSFTGTYLAFPQSLGAAIGTVLPGRDLRAPPPVGRAAGAGSPIDIDTAVTAARAALPDGVLRSVGFPARADQPYRVALAHPADRAGQPPVTVFVDPHDARVIELRDPATFSLGETVLAWQHPLHEGQGLGWLWRGLVFLSGLLPSLFVFTGLAMWLIERRARRAAVGRRVMAAEAAE